MEEEEERDEARIVEMERTLRVIGSACGVGQ
jgi:hypothetical protein